MKRQLSVLSLYLCLLLFSLPGLGQSENSTDPLLIRDTVEPGQWRYGYIDCTGEIVIQPTYVWACDFVEGRAVVGVGEGGERRYSVIDRQGHPVFSIQDGIPDTEYHEGVLKIEGDSGDYFVDTVGCRVIDGPFYRASWFSCGRAEVKYSLNGRTGFIDKQGRLVIDTVYGLGGFHECYAVVRRDGREMVIDTTGRIVFESQFDEISNGGEGLFPVRVSSKWGYADTTGQLVIEPRFDFAREFSEGRGLVRINGLYGYIDRSGQVVIEPRFFYAERFSEGLAAANAEHESMRDVTTVFIDRWGKEVVKGEFICALPFKNGFSKFWEGFHFSGSIMYVDREGNILR